MCGLTLLVLFVPEAVLGFPEDAEVSGKVVHQAGSKVRLPVHLLGPKNTPRIVTNAIHPDPARVYIKRCQHKCQ